MPIVQSGEVNILGNNVPNWFLQILSPQAAPVIGIQSNVLAAVGVGSWGPVNSIGYGSSYSDFAAQYGAMLPRTHDMGTFTQLAEQNGCSMFAWVRVTDGTDLAATGTITAASAADATAFATAINQGQGQLRGPSNYVTASATGATVNITSKYTGILGNSTVIAVTTGAKANTTRVSVALTGYNAEVFDNLGAATASPATVTLTGGTDGDTGVTSTTLVGVDATPRSGMYALRKSVASVVALVDCCTPATWPAQVAFGLYEGMYMFDAGPMGDTIANAVSAKQGAGIDSYAMHINFGDWILFNDTVNGLVRYVSPQGASAGLRAAQSPEQGILNRPMGGIVATQRNSTGQTYSDAELLQLANAGIDVIANPSVGGNYFSSRIGRNTSSNPLTRGSNYTTMTNFLARSIGNWSGQWVGKLQTVSQRATASAGLNAFLSNLQGQGMIGNVNNIGDSFHVNLSASNNPMSQVSIGIEQADIEVCYLSVIEQFLINMEGSQATVIPSGNPAAQ